MSHPAAGLKIALAILSIVQFSHAFSALNSFDAFVKMRLGVGTGPGSADVVYWVGSGELYEAYSGKLLARYEGFDVGRGVVLDGGQRVRQLSRKIFWFRDPETGELMKHFNGKPVSPIRYNQQALDYDRTPSEKNGADLPREDPALKMWTPLPPIVPSVVSSRVDIPVMPITATTAGKNRLAFQAPVFVDIDIPHVGPYQACEFYDYTCDVTYPKDQPPLAVWCRQGSNPPFAENGEGVMRFVGHRVDKFDDLPASIKELLEMEDYCLFKQPPVDMEEVERMQQLDAEQSRR